MKLSYEDAVANYSDYFEARQRAPRWALELARPINRLSAIDVVEELDRTASSFRQKADFCKRLLVGNKLTVYDGETVVCTIPVTDGTQFATEPDFINDPLVFQFVVQAVYGLFLKQSAGRLLGSHAPLPEQK